MNQPVTEIVQAANGQWPQVFASLGINIPKHGKHGPCPICGGKDRFRCDDKEGRGTWFCNQCEVQAGDGLSLVASVSQLSAFDAAKHVASAIGQTFGSVDPIIVEENKCRADHYKKEAMKRNDQSAKKTQERARQIKQRTQLGASSYLKSKGLDLQSQVLKGESIINIGGISFQKDDLFISMLNFDQEIVNCQLINADGAKRYLPSGIKSNCFHKINGNDDVIAITEGYATALTINLAIEATTYIAFDCGNLKNVARIARKNHPKATIIVCGDNDTKTKGNPGKTKAAEAAKEIDAIALVPESSGDWNDAYQRDGIEEIKSILLSAIQSDESKLRVNNKQLEPWELERLSAIGKDNVHIVVGAKHRIMIWKHCPVDGVRPTFESINDFQNYFLHLPTIAGLNQGKALMSWTGKVFYPNGLGYYPDTGSLPKYCYNLFRGWGVEPMETVGLEKDPELAIIKVHLEEVICDGDSKAYHYLVGWLAQMLQFPAEKPPVAILLKSVEGSGKGTVYELIKSMLGSNAYQVNGNGQLVGRFNSIIDGRLFVFGDEVDMTDKTQYDKLKSLISEKTQSVERKGLEPAPVRVLARFMFTGNHDHLIKAGTNERRWLVLEPSGHKQEDREYWNQLYRAIRGNAPAKLLHYLLTLDLNNFDVRRPPVTQGLIDQKLASLKIQEVWMYEQLVLRIPFSGKARITAPEAIDDFIHFAESNGEHFTKPKARSLVGKIMSATGLTVIGRSDRGDGIRFYDLPEVMQMREAFARYLKHKPEEIF
ncbi:MAG: toprim domain-containing protein [Psychrobium sp.]|nr:toprim domain-containing protein [Psychrobium sp.]